MNDTLIISSHACNSIVSQNAGYFVSRGEGIHPTRTITSHELIFVDQGTLHIRERDRRFEVGERQSLLLFPGREHGGTVPYAADLRFYWIHFEVIADAAVGARGSRRQAVPQIATVGRSERLRQLFRWFLDDQESDRLQAHAASLLILLMLTEVADARPDPSAACGGSALLASRAMQHVRLHYPEALSTSGVARALKCNPDYLGRVFKGAYRRTLTDAIHRERLREARRQLLEGRANVNEVAARSGYRDPGYFRRVFRACEGMTPGAYRRLYSRVRVNTA